MAIEEWATGTYCRIGSVRRMEGEMEQIRTWIREQLSIVTDQAWLSFSRRVHLVACGGGDEPQPHELAILRLLQSAGQRRDGKADGEADDKGDEGTGRGGQE